jgi:hypothetical protein
MAFEVAKAKAGKVSGEGCHGFKEFEAVPDEILYMDGKVMRQGFTCGEWAKFGGPVATWRASMAPENWALLTHGFVWHPDAFSIASKVVDHLGVFQYNALHGRYGDLQYQDVKTDPVKIFENQPSLLQGVQKLYIASDNPEKFDGLDYGNVQAVRWGDLFSQQEGNLLNAERAKYTPERWFKLMGAVEEIICTFAKVFVGTRLSSFSGHIERMRMHAHAPVTDVQVHDVPEIPGKIQQSIALWKDKEANYHVDESNKGDVFLQMSEDRSPIR